MQDHTLKFGYAALRTLLHEKTEEKLKDDAKPVKSKEPEQKKQEPKPAPTTAQTPSTRDVNRAKKDEERRLLVVPHTGGGMSNVGRATRGRMMSDSKGLLRDLGVTRSFPGDDIEQAIAIMKKAIESNEVMGAAYGNVKMNTTDGKTFGVVTMKELPVLDGVRFAAYTLHAAINAGLYSPKKPMATAKSTSGSVVLKHDD